jgi:hypothetical protein
MKTKINIIPREDGEKLGMLLNFVFALRKTSGDFVYPNIMIQSL